MAVTARNVSDPDWQLIHDEGLVFDARAPECPVVIVAPGVALASSRDGCTVLASHCDFHYCNLILHTHAHIEQRGLLWHLSVATVCLFVKLETYTTRSVS